MNNSIQHAEKDCPDLDAGEPGGIRMMAQPGRAIGAILMDAGKLSLQDAERVHRLQRDRGMRFGEAAGALGLLSEDDIQRALSSQYDYAYLPDGDTSLDRSLAAAHRPFSPAVEELRALRSQLLLRWFSAGADRRTLAVVSPGRGDGRSHIAANLAVVFSQLGQRTLLIDADLRQPRQHRLFGRPEGAGLTEILGGRSGHEVIAPIPTLRNLSLLPAGLIPPNPQELLARPALLSLLDTLGSHYEVILLDTPPAGEFADAYTVANRARATLLVARQHHSLLSKTCELAHNLPQYGSTVVGCTLNRG